MIGVLIGIVMFWGVYFLYKYFSERYWKKKRAEWHEELLKVSMPNHFLKRENWDE